MTDDWDKSIAEDKYSDFCKYMHELDLVVHPWPLQDDRLVYRDSGYGETRMYVEMGSDGLFAEFPDDTYKWFTDLGLRSRLEHTNESHDFSSVCPAERFRYQSMSLEVLFGDKAS